MAINLERLADDLINATKKIKKGGFVSAGGFVEFMEKPEGSRLLEVYSEFFEIPNDPTPVHFGRHIKEMMDRSPEFKKISRLRKRNNLTQFQFYWNNNEPDQDWDDEMVSLKTERRWEVEEKKHDLKGKKLGDTKNKQTAQVTPKAEQKTSLFIHFGGLCQSHLLFKAKVPSQECLDEIQAVIKKHFLK